MRLVDERVEKQKTRCFARTSRQRRSQSRNRSRIPRRDIAAREDRTFLFHVRATFLQHEDYRGRSEYAAEQGSRRERSVEKGNKRKVPRIDGEGQRGLREGVILGVVARDTSAGKFLKKLLDNFPAVVHIHTMPKELDLSAVE